jgi:uncharacterized protein YjbI with pentapeptide repeats
LLKLWEALAEAPATWNKAPIGDSIRPWMIADYALSFRKDGPVRLRPLRRLANAVSGLLIFWAAPAVLAGFWWRSMPKHDEVLTVIFCGVPLCVSVYVGVASWLRLRRLSRGDATTLEWRRPGKTGWTAFSSIVALAGWFTTEGTLEDYARRLGFENEAWWSATPFPWLLVPAKLEGVVFVETPPDWKVFDEARQAFRLEACQAEGLTPTLCGKFYESDSATVTNLKDLREDWCAQSFRAVARPSATFCSDYFSGLDERLLYQWGKERKEQLARLQRRDLTRLDLRRANLRGAVLDSANLTAARLEEADLTLARLEGADLRQARLEGAELREARLEGAILLVARLKGADLTRARFEGANLIGASLEAAKLYLARLEGANLTFASLQGTDLNSARLEGAHLTRTRFDAATNWSGAALRGATVRSVDFSTTPISVDQVTLGFGDGSSTLPAGMPWPSHWPKPELGWMEFNNERDKWLADPSAYVPPPPPTNQ